MRTYEDIKSDIKDRFEGLVSDTVAEGSILDFYNSAMAEQLADVYEEIEENKTPYLWSKLYGDNLDDMGALLNCTRKDNENDGTYRYRLMKWVLSNEASNGDAVAAALLSPVYASNIDFVPYIKGTGTAACYVIPKDYSTETIENALKEAEDIMKNTASPALHVEYIIPTVKAVTLQIYISSKSGDIAVIKADIESRIKEYINSIAPKDYLEVGTINRIGVDSANVDYFSVLSVMLDGVVQDSIKLLQGTESKMLFDKIIWTE